MACNECNGSKVERFRTLDTSKWIKLHDVDLGEYQVILKKDPHSNLKSIEVLGDCVNEGIHHQQFLHEAIFFYKEVG